MFPADEEEEEGRAQIVAGIDLFILTDFRESGEKHPEEKSESEQETRTTLSHPLQPTFLHPHITLLSLHPSIPPLLRLLLSDLPPLFLFMHPSIQLHLTHQSSLPPSISPLHYSSTSSSFPLFSFLSALPLPLPLRLSLHPHLSGE